MKTIKNLFLHVFYFYALFAARPGIFSPRERAKWDAWKAVEGNTLIKEILTHFMSMIDVFGFNLKKSHGLLQGNLRMKQWATISPRWNSCWKKLQLQLLLFDILFLVPFGALCLNLITYGVLEMLLYRFKLWMNCSYKVSCLFSSINMEILMLNGS